MLDRRTTVQDPNILTKAPFPNPTTFYFMKMEKAIAREPKQKQMHSYSLTQKIKHVLADLEKKALVFANFMLGPFVVFADIESHLHLPWQNDKGEILGQFLENITCVWAALEICCCQ